MPHVRKFGLKLSDPRCCQLVWDVVSGMSALRLFGLSLHVQSGPEAVRSELGRLVWDVAVQSGPEAVWSELGCFV